MAEGEVIKTGKSVCLSKAVIKDGENGRLLAHGTATMMVLESLQIDGQSHLPPKFLD